MATSVYHVHEFMNGYEFCNGQEGLNDGEYLWLPKQTINDRKNA